MNNHLLIIDDDKAICRTLERHFLQRGFAVSTAHNVEDGLAQAMANSVDAVISDIRLPGRDGISLLADLRRQRPNVPVIMITAFHDMETTVMAIQNGAADYVSKPIDLDELDIAIDRSLFRGHDTERGLVLAAKEPGRTQMIGQSSAMMDVFKSIALIAQSRVTVLILGESGTGKELVARAIHSASAGRTLPFVAINCATLVETLLESEMFGHERGAFTGAVSAHKGKIEMVGEGTLFLDEVAELSQSMQGKLLRVLEEREYSPVGSTQTKKSGARFITATNVDLQQRIDQNLFRQDLFYRLNVACIHLPPLRDRRGDIPILVDYLLRKINRDLRKNIRRISGDAMECLGNYHWPGNVRQLENVLMKASVMESGDILTKASLPLELLAPASDKFAGVKMKAGEGLDSLCSLKELEHEHIKRVLATTHWHKGRACEILGMSRPRLERRIREFGLTNTRSDES